METAISQIADHQRKVRRDALLYRVLDGLRATARPQGLTPDTPVDDVCVEFTTDSAAYLAPVIEAVLILEDIMYASDGCRGHRGCLHSMDPWQRMRDLLTEKWNADMEAGSWPERQR